MVLAKPRWSAHGQYVFDNHAGAKFAANNLGLAVDATKSGDNKKRNTIVDCCHLETAPSICSAGGQHVIFAIGPYFRDFKAGRLLALAKTANGQKLV